MFIFNVFSSCQRLECSAVEKQVRSHCETILNIVNAIIIVINTTDIIINNIIITIFFVMLFCLVSL